MRFKAKSVLLALVAVFAMSAVMAAAASAAEPEFKPVPAKKKFTIGGGTSKWVIGKSTITCAKSSATGEIDSAETVGNVVVAYSGCKSSGKVKSGCPVSSTGAKAEEIVTNALAGELGTVATGQAPSGVGLRFKESVKHQGWFTLQENECTIAQDLAGGLAAEVTVIGKKQATNKLVLQPSTVAGTEGEKIKEITLDSGIVERPELEAFGTEVSIKAEGELKFEEAVEVT